MSSQVVSQETLRSVVLPYPGPLPISRAPRSLSTLNLFNNCNACAKHAEETFHAKHIFIISSGTLARSTSALKDLQAALGDKVVGVKFGLKAHTYLDDAAAIAEECRKLNVDLIVTLGGGSLTDAAKIVSLALANDVIRSEDFLKLPTARTAGTVAPAKACTVPVVCITTTLSGGEFTGACGATDERDSQKHQFIVGNAIQLVILDAELVTNFTPLSLLLQSGIRAVDHSVESICSLYCNEVTEMHAKKALERLVPALLRCKADDAKTDVEARLLCQMASLDAIAAFGQVYTPQGASHAIGHMLGPFGVGHGQTSGILLPAVCKYNALHKANIDRQEIVTAILWGVPEMQRLAESKGLQKGVADLGDLLDVLVRALGMPRTLVEVSVGRDKLDQLAEYSLLDVWSAANPVPLTEKAQVMEILEMVVG
ncbi:putative Fe-containing alcohol dehydrogenase [Mycena epipterygia]|nr:putative Fe-containing alcohol dehydrogenase [Mycena epipterygia]